MSDPHIYGTVRLPRCRMRFSDDALADQPTYALLGQPSSTVEKRFSPAASAGDTVVVMVSSAGASVADRTLATIARIGRG